MMAEKLQKHTFHFFEGDVAKLKDLYPTLSVANVIRGLIRQHILNVEKAVGAVKGTIKIGKLDV
jgi:hypothetical protein